ncbi:hypothetical protein H5410_048104 [Solanum commersonii]|uniref:Uncharacterized protein n=1 Tax=Solanum commersonii TaxID=4109 RepID=A0A9J5XKP2_SOLCO|nr:hypothetical protein H5410_048104 [Solanum commersonii]
MDNDQSIFNPPIQTDFKNILITPIPFHPADPDIEIVSPPEATTEPQFEANTGDQKNQVTQEAEGDCITLSKMEKERIYKLWCFSIIIKLLGKKMSHEYFRRKLSLLWRPSEELILPH